MSNLIDPNITARQAHVKDMAVRAMKSLENEAPLEVVHALCLALAKAASFARVSHIEDVKEQLGRMFQAIEAARPSDGPNPRLRVVSPEQFKRISESFGIKFD